MNCFNNKIMNVSLFVFVFRILIYIIYKVLPTMNRCDITTYYYAFGFEKIQETSTTTYNTADRRFSGGGIVES